MTFGVPSGKTEGSTSRTGGQHHRNTQASPNAYIISYKNVNVEKYINAFQAINNRVDPLIENYKYERCCLLLVDFDRQIPKIYNTSQELISDGYLGHASPVTMTGLDYNSFVTDILDIYTARFPANSFN